MFKYENLSSMYPATMKILKNNQFIRETRKYRIRLKKVINYLEKDNIIVKLESVSGNILCMRRNDDKLFETSMEVVESLMKESCKYTKKEMEYSILARIHCNLVYLDDIKPKLRKLQCVLNRIKLKIKELIKKDVKRKNFKTNKKQSRLFEYLMSVRLFRK